MLQAVNSGILGGFSAFDVRALSEGHHQELQRLRNARAQQAAQAAAVSQQQQAHAAQQQQQQAHAQQQQQQQQLLQQQLLRQSQVLISVDVIMKLSFVKLTHASGTVASSIAPHAAILSPLAR